jgi:hypothetical protein
MWDDIMKAFELGHGMGYGVHAWGILSGGFGISPAGKTLIEG